MSTSTPLKIEQFTGPLFGRGFTPSDPNSTGLRSKHVIRPGTIMTGIVEQFNVGLYSARIFATNEKYYTCLIGAQNIAAGFGYSDSTVLREGDEVIFCTTADGTADGMILAKKPMIYSVDSRHQVQVRARDDLDRRTHFHSNDCYRPETKAYQQTLDNPNDMSTRRYGNNRPSDLLPGETGTLNQHRCGVLGGLYSTSIIGGGAHIRLFSLENRIREVADSIARCTMVGNADEWHNRRYLSKERSACLYQEERLGMSGKEQQAFDEADYKKEGYFTKNKKKRQTLKPRLLEHEGYYGGLSAKYCLRPDPDNYEPRTLDDRPIDPGVMRESVDPSGQYRLATTGMLGLERIGRIPVPIRIRKPWSKEAEEPRAEALVEFEHSEDNPYYRQLEHADRVAYDLKNSYARLDEAETEFYTPEESDLENKLRDVYDQGFTDSTTVRLEKYDKRRSGIWQGEDGSIIIRDAWGSEIVMIGGNIQLSCAGNVEVLPGKSTLIMSGDDTIVKAQNSIDITAADKDVRVNALHDIQMLAGSPATPGGITLETKGEAYPWDMKTPPGGEVGRTVGIHLKSHDGALITDTKNTVLRSKEIMSIVAGDEAIAGGPGKIFMSASGLYTYGDTAVFSTEKSAVLLSDSAVLLGTSAVMAGEDGATVISGDEVMIPLMWASCGTDVYQEVMEGLQPFIEFITDEERVAIGYSAEKLEKMIFKFRNSMECSTLSSWELNGPDVFTLYQPFWLQVESKFETLRGVDSKEFDDHVDEWGGDIGNPWPGTDAVNSAQYAYLPSGPVNMTDDGLNKPRKSVVRRVPVSKKKLFPGYMIRK